MDPDPQYPIFHFYKRGNFQRYWRLAEVIPVPKESSSSDFGDSRPISYSRHIDDIWKDRDWEVAIFLEGNSAFFSVFK